MSSQDYQNYLNDMVNSDIKYRTDNNETVEAMNQRIRKSIQLNFNKIFLSKDKQNLFRIWEENVDTLPNTATREELYGAAPEDCLHIIGI